MVLSISSLFLQFFLCLSAIAGLTTSSRPDCSNLDEFCGKSDLLKLNQPPTLKWLNVSVSLDHFSASPNSSHFWLRSQYVDQYYQPGGPILLLVGPERGLSSFELYTSSLLSVPWLTGFPQRPFLIATEHRYFGASLPFGPNSFTLSALQFLSINQTLADNIAVLRFFQSTFPQLAGAPIIALGGSYGGWLAASLRIFYPEQISGAIASCTVPYLYSIIPADNNVEPFSWYELVSKTYTETPGLETCGLEIEEEFQALQEEFSSGNFESVQIEFKLCDSIITQTQRSFFSWLKVPFTFASMFDYQTPAVFCVARPLGVLCSNSTLNNTKYFRIQSALQLYYNKSGDVQDCFDWQGLRPSLPQVCKNPHQNHQERSKFHHANLDSIKSSNPDFPMPEFHISSGKSNSFVPTYDPWLFLSCSNWGYASGYGIGIFQEGSTGWTLKNRISSCQHLIPGLEYKQYPPLLVYNPSSPDNPTLGFSFTNVVFSWAEFDANRGWSPSLSVNESLGIVSVPIYRNGHTADLTQDIRHSPVDPNLAQAVQTEVQWAAKFIESHKLE